MTSEMRKKFRMTINQFLDKLRQTPRDWFIDPISGDLRRKGADGEEQCPISSLGNVEVGDYEYVGRSLGLSRKDIDQIAYRADENTRHPLRLGLLLACGLDYEGHRQCTKPKTVTPSPVSASKDSTKNLKETSGDLLSQIEPPCDQEPISRTHQVVLRMRMLFDNMGWRSLSPSKKKEWAATE